MFKRRDSLGNLGKNVRFFVLQLRTNIQQEDANLMGIILNTAQRGVALPFVDTLMKIRFPRNKDICS
jgi:hypothetical protein